LRRLERRRGEIKIKRNHTQKFSGKGAEGDSTDSSPPVSAVQHEFTRAHWKRIVIIEKEQTETGRGSGGGTLIPNNVIRTITYTCIEFLSPMIN